MPSGPTSQHTDGDGEAPAASVTVAPVCWSCQVDPPSAERCTFPPGTIRHRLDGFVETMTVSGAPTRAAARFLSASAEGDDNADALAAA